MAINFNLSADEKGNFERGKAIATNSDRQQTHGARINLQRYRLRRKYLCDCLNKHGWIGSEPMYEDGKSSTFETYRFVQKLRWRKCHCMSLPEFCL